jgi:6-phosphogluconolactonase
MIPRRDKTDQPCRQVKSRVVNPEKTLHVTDARLVSSNLQPAWRLAGDLPENHAAEAIRFFEGGGSAMEVEVFADDESAARAAAKRIVAESLAAVAARGRFVMAVSGGHSPWIMLRILAKEELPWERVHVFQVDERIAPIGHADRNLTHLQECLLGHAPMRPEQIHAMAVELPDLEAAAAQYGSILREIAGTPPELDLVHLGLGPDGHTASLVPQDPVLNVTDKDVALSGAYQGRRRMTLTYPIINRARNTLWLVTGSEKAGVLGRLREGDGSIPAGRVQRGRALLFADRAAVAKATVPAGLRNQ